MSKKEKAAPMEEGLLRAMKALDGQIARAMSRSPAERETHGVQKWEPISQRIERVCVLILDALGDREIELDSVLVLAQALPKALTLIAEDLGIEGLGKLRSDYCSAAAETILSDAERLRRRLKGETELM